LTPFENYQYLNLLKQLPGGVGAALAAFAALGAGAAGAQELLRKLMRN
jgi:hypothetical protein